MGRWLERSLVLLLCLAAALWLVRGAGEGLVIGGGIDLPGTLWFHGHVDAVLSGQALPWRTDQFYAPDGLNLFTRMGANLVDGLVAWPFFAALGMPAHYAPFLVALLLGNGLAMAQLVRGRGGSAWAAGMAGVCLIVHPFVQLELAEGRPTQAFLWFWPLALHHLLRALDSGGRRDALWAGLFVGLQAWTYWFAGHMWLLCLVPALALMAGRDRRRWTVLLTAAGAATVTVAPAVVPMLWARMAGGVPFLDQALGAEHAMSTDDLRRAFGWILPGSSALPARPDVPIWALVLPLGCIWAVRRGWAWALAYVLACALAVAPRFWVADTALANPLWWAADGLPFMERFWFPYRFWALGAVLGVPLAAWTLDHGLRRLPAPARPLPWVLLFGALMASTPALPTMPLSAPAYTAVIAAAPGPVLDLPFPCTDEVIHHQLWHGQPLLTGMGVGAAGYADPMVRQRLTEDSSVSRGAIFSARGETVAAAPWDGRPQPGDPRWVVLHTGLFATIRTKQGCWGAPDVRAVSERIRMAQFALQAWLGAPTFRDEHAWAWDLQAARD